MSLAKTILQSVKWSILAEIATRAVSPVVFLILARILLPDDFGVAAAATVVISFSQILWEAGLSKALIQRQERVREAANTVFWINLILGIVLFLLLLALADAIASFFDDVRIARVISVLGLQLPLSALASVHVALFQKDFHFKKLFWIRLITISAPAVSSIPLAMSGAGYWALVAGTLAGQMAQTLTLWVMSPWRPNLGFDRGLAAELGRFGSWSMAESLLGWFYIWADTLIVGKVLGTTSLGIYKVGNDIVLLVYGVLISSLIPAIYSALAKAQSDREKIREAILHVQFIVFAIALPVGIGFFLFGEHISLILGEKWIQTGEVVAVLGLMHGLSWLVAILPEAYRAIGRPDVITKIMVIALLYYLPGYYISVAHGLHAFLWTRFCLFIAGQGMHYYAAYSILAIRPIHIYSNIRSILIAGILSLLPYLLLRLTSPIDDLAGLTIHVASFYVVNGGMSWLFYRHHVAVKRLRATLR